MLLMPIGGFLIERSISYFCFFDATGESKTLEPSRCLATLTMDFYRKVLQKAKLFHAGNCVAILRLLFYLTLTV